MGRKIRVLSAAVGAVCASTAGPRPALAQQSIAGMLSPVRAVSHAMSTIASAGVSGIVIDEHESPLAGAMVSVLGASTAMTLTDASGRFSLQALPPGDYSVRAHLTGFTASPRENIRLVAAAPVTFPPAAASPRRAGGDDRRPRSARRHGQSSPRDSACRPQSRRRTPSRADDDHSHTDTAWRLRHLTRSILKDSASTVPVEAEEPDPRGRLHLRADDIVRERHSSPTCRSRAK